MKKTVLFISALIFNIILSCQTGEKTELENTDNDSPSVVKPDFDSAEIDNTRVGHDSIP